MDLMDITDFQRKKKFMLNWPKTVFERVKKFPEKNSKKYVLLIELPKLMQKEMIEICYLLKVPTLVIWTT